MLTVWGDDVYVTPFENGVKNRLARMALTDCDAVTGDSSDILAVAADLGADPSRSFRILWGVDFEVFQPGRDREWRLKLGFGDDDLLYFSPRSYTRAKLHRPAGPFRSEKDPAPQVVPDRTLRFQKRLRRPL